MRTACTSLVQRWRRCSYRRTRFFCHGEITTKRSPDKRRFKPRTCAVIQAPASLGHRERSERSHACLFTNTLVFAASLLTSARPSAEFALLAREMLLWPDWKRKQPTLLRWPTDGSRPSAIHVMVVDRDGPQHLYMLLGGRSRYHLGKQRWSMATMVCEYTWMLGHDGVRGVRRCRPRQGPRRLMIGRGRVDNDVTGHDIIYVNNGGR